MHEVTDTPNKPLAMNYQYKPPIFKKDFFDKLIKKDNKEEIETEQDDKPAEEKGLINKFMSSFKQKEDIHSHEVNIIKYNVT
jgi:hypothetical protein